MLELMPPLAALCPPATVIDKTRYSSFAEPQLSAHLRHSIFCQSHRRNIHASIATTNHAVVARSKASAGVRSIISQMTRAKQRARSFRALRPQLPAPLLPCRASLRETRQRLAGPFHGDVLAEFSDGVFRYGRRYQGRCQMMRRNSDVRCQ